MDSLVGQILQNRYRVVSRLAAGGMGVVYKGERLELERPVAIKFVHEWAAAEPAMRKRFEIEVRAMGRLQHPCCVSITDFGVHDNAPYVVMDFVEGITLDDLIDRGPVAVPRALDIVDKILAGLAHAHDKGVVHRDIKPKNIMITETEGFADEVRILDFGLAKLREQNTGLTIGMAIGTPSYMAPEQTRNDPVDARTDVYAVGLILYEMLTGERPFVADDAHELMRMQREDPPPPLQNLIDEPIGRHLQAILACALAKDPASRYASAGEFAAAVREGRRAPTAQEAAETRALTPIPAPLVTGLTHAEPLGGGRTHVDPMRSQPVIAATGARRGLWIGLGVAVAIALIATIAIVATRGDDPTAASSTADAAAAKPDVAAKPTVPARKAAPTVTTPPPTKPADTLDAIEALIRDNRRGEALAALRKLRTKQPKNARIHYLLGNLHFHLPWWSEMLQNYRRAIELDATYRLDTHLITNIIALFKSPKYAGQASWFLRKQVGVAAIPHLTKLASDTKNRAIRQRARWTISAIQPGTE